MLPPIFGNFIECAANDLHVAATGIKLGVLYRRNQLNKKCIDLGLISKY